VNGIEQLFLTTKPGKTGSYLQKSKVLINTTK